MSETQLHSLTHRVFVPFFSAGGACCQGTLSWWSGIGFGVEPLIFIQGKWEPPDPPNHQAWREADEGGCRLLFCGVSFWLFEAMPIGVGGSF